MFYEITTTITTRVEIGDDGISGISHSVDVAGGEIAAALGSQTTMRFVKAACEATINSIDKGEAKTVVEVDPDDD